MFIHGYLPEYFPGLARYQKHFSVVFVRDEGTITGSHQKSLGVVHIDVCSSLSGHVYLLCPTLGFLCWLGSLLLKPEKPKNSLHSQKRWIPKAKTLYPPCVCSEGPQVLGYTVAVLCLDAEKKGGVLSVQGKQSSAWLSLWFLSSSAYLQPARPPGPEVLGETLSRSAQLMHL